MAKKIALISTFSVIVILIITTVILAVVPKSFKPEFVKPDYIIYSNSNISTVPGKENQAFEKLYDAFEVSFKKSYLTAIFDGTSGTKITADTINDSFSKTDFIKLQYNLVQILKIGGKDYVTETTNKKIEYDAIWLSTSAENEFKTVTFYLTNNSELACCKVTTIANTSALYELIKELSAK